MKTNRFIRYLQEYPRVIWECLKIFFYLMLGIWKVLKLTGPRVTFFGSSRMQKNDPFFSSAKNLSRKLVENGISIITGGGPGIMEAANCGAASVAKKRDRFMSLAVGIRGLKWQEKINVCAQDSISFDSFFVRKWLLTNYSSAFVVFPGGFGTLDELGEVLNLIETSKIKRLPVILFGKEYWAPLMTWVTDSALKHGAINQEEVNIIRVTDDFEEIFCILLKHCN